MWKNGKDHYGLASMFFHWTIALAFIGLVGLGAWMVELTYYDSWYHDSLSLHKTIGIVVLALALAKFSWRFTDRKPEFEREVRAYERAGATAMHWILGSLLILLPVTGYLISTSEGAGIAMFGLFELPAVFEISERIRDLAVEVHFYLAYGGIVLVSAHAGAALKHHFMDKGSTLMRMLIPRSPPRRTD